MDNQKKTRKSRLRWTRLPLIAAILIWSTLMAVLALSNNVSIEGTSSGNLLSDANGVLLTYSSQAQVAAAGEDKVNTSGASASVQKPADGQLTLAATSSTYTTKEEGCPSTTNYYYAGTTTITVTITNPSSATSAVWVDSVTASVGTVTVEPAFSEDDPLILAPGESFTTKFAAAPDSPQDNASNSASATITVAAHAVSNVNLTLKAPNLGYTVTTVDPTEETGSFSVATGGTSETNALMLGTVVTLPASSAVAVDGYHLYGWQLSTGDLLHYSKDANGAEQPLTFTINNNTTIAPVYISASKYPLNASGQYTYTNSKGATSLGPYSVNGTRYLFWRDAVAAAKSTGKPVVLAEDFTLPTTLADNGITFTDGANVSGTDGNLTYTVPAGVTFQVPYDDANTLHTTAPGLNTYVKPTVYRTLTMPAGTGFNVLANGAISLSAQQSKSGNNGSPSGPMSFVNMASGAKITVQNGGALYVWGYITGSGSVEILGGGTVYECFQVSDWRGGNATNAINDPKTNPGVEGHLMVFPFSQYHVQNVEVPMTIHAGATEYCYMSISVSGMGMTFDDGSAVPLIGPTAMFSLESGSYLVKDYDEANDRLNVEIHGDATMGSISISLSVSIMTIGLNSKDFVMPINPYMTVTICEESDLLLKQTLSFLPGTQFIIEKDATVTLDSGISMYVYDLDEWITNDDGTAGYSGISNKSMVALAYAPGRIKTRTEKDLVDAYILVNGTLDASNGYLYTSASGGNIHSTGNGVVKIPTTADSNDYQILQSGNTVSSYPSIAVTSAQLKNGAIWDESAPYTATSGAAGSYYYNADHQKWVKDGHTLGEEYTIESTCTTPGAVNADCSCGYTETVDELPLAAHTEEVVTPETGATCTAGGMTAGTACSVCGEPISTPEPDGTTALGHQWQDGECQREGCDEQFSIVTCNIAVRDGLDMFFYVDPSDIAGPNTFTAKVTKVFADGREPVIMEFPSAGEDVNKWEYHGGYGLYRFRFSDISAKEMTDDITVVIYNSDGTQASYEFVSSIQDYAMATLAAFPDDVKLRTALVDMLNYGDACQIQFGYGTDSMATSELTETQKAYGTQANVTCVNTNFTKGTSLYAASFSAKNTLVYTFYYDFDANNDGNPDISLDGSDTIATVTYTDHHGIKRTFTSSDWFARQYGSKILYGIDITGIPIASGRSVLTCTISGGTNSVTTDSIEGYTARTPSSSTNLYNTMNMLMRFVDSAKAYFTN